MSQRDRKHPIKFLKERNAPIEISIPLFPNIESNLLNQFLRKNKILLRKIGAFKIDSMK